MTARTAGAGEQTTPWAIVRQFAHYRAVLMVNGGWVEEGSHTQRPGLLLPAVRTFRTAKEAEAFLRRNVGTHFNEFVSRVKS